MVRPCTTFRLPGARNRAQEVHRHRPKQQCEQSITNPSISASKASRTPVSVSCLQKTSSRRSRLDINVSASMSVSVKRLQPLRSSVARPLMELKWLSPSPVIRRQPQRFNLVSFGSLFAISLRPRSVIFLQCPMSRLVICGQPLRKERPASSHAKVVHMSHSIICWPHEITLRPHMTPWDEWGDFKVNTVPSSLICEQPASTSDFKRGRVASKLKRPM